MPKTIQISHFTVEVDGVALDTIYDDLTKAKRRARNASVRHGLCHVVAYDVDGESVGHAIYSDGYQAGIEGTMADVINSDAIPADAPDLLQTVVEHAKAFMLESTGGDPWNWHRRHGKVGSSRALDECVYGDGFHENHAVRAQAVEQLTIWAAAYKPEPINTAVRYFIAVDADPRARAAILATAMTELDAVENAAAYTGDPVSEFVAIECTKELFEKAGAGECFSFDDTRTPADVNVDEHDVDRVVDFITDRMIFDADHGRKMIRDSSGAAEELRPYAVPLESDMAHNQDLYEVVELLQSQALMHQVATDLDAWIYENSERKWELVGMETGTVYGKVIARNAEHALAAGEDVDAKEDLEARKVMHLEVA